MLPAHACVVDLPWTQCYLVVVDLPYTQCLPCESALDAMLPGGCVVRGQVRCDERY